jgi:hypothetical protein
LSRTTSSRYRFWATEENIAPLLASAARIASHAASEGAMGFSHSTLIPASRKSMLSGSCVDGGVQMLTRSTSPRAMTSAWEACTVAPSTPSCDLTPSALSGFRSQSATIVHRSPSAW